MTTIRAVITVKDQSLRNFHALVQAGLGGGGRGGKGTAAGASNPYEDWRKQVGRIYGAFAASRYNRFSRGGGDWPALAVSTIAGRRGPDAKRAKAKASQHPWDLAEGNGVTTFGARSSLARDTSRPDRYGKAGKLVGAGGRELSILRDTNIMFRAVHLGGVGNRVTRLSNGIQYGFDDSSHGPGHFAKLAAQRKALAAQFSKRTRLTLGTEEATRTITAAKKRHALLESAGRGRSGGFRTFEAPGGGAKGGVRSAPLTIGQLATFHHFGMGNNPVRRILVEPDGVTSDLITRALNLATRKAIAISKRGGA